MSLEQLSYELIESDKPHFAAIDEILKEFE